MTLEDAYELGPRLGAGAGGTVFQATRRRDGHPVAIKTLNQADEIPEARQRLLAEARLLAQVRSPHVVQVLDVGEDPQHVWLVMERLDGTSLQHLLDAEVRLGTRRAFALAAGVARGLAALHAAGIVHRDVKPANIMVTRPGHAVLVDLGLALGVGRGVRTKTGIMLGTPGYLAPETLRGQQAGPPADVFALGLTLFRMLQGRLPYGGRDGTDLIRAQLRGLDPDAIPALPRAERAALADLLEDDPAARPAAEVVATRLAEASVAPVPAAGVTQLASAASPSSPTVMSAPASRPSPTAASAPVAPTPPTPPPQPDRRGWVAAALVALSGVVGLGLGGGPGAAARPLPSKVDPYLDGRLMATLEAFSLEDELVDLAGGSDDAVRQMLVDLDHQSPGVGFRDEVGHALRPAARIREWRDAVRARPWWQAWHRLSGQAEAGMDWTAGDDPTRAWPLLRALQRLQDLARVERRLHRAGPLLPGLDELLEGAVRVRQVPAPYPAPRGPWKESIPGLCVALVDQASLDYPKGLIGLQRIGCPGSLCLDRPWEVARRWPLSALTGDEGWVGLDLGVIDLHATGAPTLQVLDRDGRVALSVSWRPLESPGDFYAGADCTYVPDWVRFEVRRELLPPASAGSRLVYRELLAPLDARVGHDREEYVNLVGVPPR